MANEVNIDSLSIQISANAEPAAKSIGDLASAVKKFNSAIAGSKGFGDLVTLANASKTASDNMQDAPGRLRELASALSEISQSMKGLKIPSDLSKGLSEISTSVRSISANVGQRLHSLAAGLSALHDVGEVRISSSIGTGISAINEALANLNVNNLSRIDRFVESVRQLEVINNLTISGSLAREITNIAEAAELVGEVDYTPLRDMGNAIAHLAVANDIRINNHLAENIVNLGIAAQEVQGTDWTEFERMAAGLRSLEGLGQIRIPRLPGARRTNGNTNDDGTPTRDAGAMEELDGIARAANDADESVGGLNNSLQNTSNRLSEAGNAASQFMQQMGGGFLRGSGLSGIASQLQQIFASPATAIGYGAGMALRMYISYLREFVTTVKSFSIKAFTTGVKALQTALSGVASAAKAAGKALVSLGKTGMKALAGIAKIEFKGIAALPQLFAKSVASKISDVAKSIGGFVRSLGRIAFYRAIRTAIKEVTKAFSEGIGNLYQWSLLVDRTFADSMDKIATSMLYLKNSLGAAVAPIINALAPAIDMLVDKFVDGINVVNQFFAAITGSDTYVAALKTPTEWAENETEKAMKNIKDLKKAILGFDELNLLTRDTRSDTAKNGKDVDDYASMFENRPVDSAISDFAKKIRAAFESGEWTSIGNMFADKLNGWVDGIDWYGLGVKLGNGINVLVDTYNGFMDNVDWFNIGESFADSLNGLLGSVNWYELGRALTQHVDALFGVFAGFVDRFDWASAGRALADAVWGMFNGIDWDRIGVAIGKAILGVATTVIEFAKLFPWTSVGRTLASAANKMFDNVDWTKVSDGINGVIDGALDGLITFIDNFSWTKHGEALRDGLVKLVTGFPAVKVADALTGSLWGILQAAMPTLKDQEFMRLLGFKLADFFNGLFNPKKDFWGTAGDAANALLVDLLTIGDSFVTNFKEKTAADSIRKALDKIEWGTIASQTWEVIRKFFNKAGSFANVLFSDESNSKWDPWEKMYVPDNSVSLGTRIANSLKKVLSGVPWESIASDTWKWVKNGFKSAYNFVTAMFGLDEGDVASYDKKIRAIGSKIGSELRSIPWASIASQVWSDIKTAFSHAGNFIDALLGDETHVEYDSMLRMNRIVKDTRSFGTKLGARISEAIANIDWKQFATDIGTGADNLFTNIADFFKKIRDDGTLTKAIEDFFSGLPADLPDKIVSAAYEMLLTIGQAIGKAIWEGIKLMFTPDTVKRELAGEISTGVGSWGGAGVGSNETLPGDEDPWTFGDLFGAHAAEGSGQYSEDFFKNNSPKQSNGVSGIANIFKQLKTTIENVWGEIKTATVNGWNATISSISTAMTTLQSVIMTAFTNLATVGIPGKMSAFNTAITTGWTTINNATSLAMTTFQSLVLTALTNLTVGIPVKMTSFATSMTTGWATINASTATAMTLLQNTILTVLTNLATVGIPIKMSTYSNLFTTGWATINSVAATAMTLFQNTVLTALTNLATVGIPMKVTSFTTTFTNGWYTINSVTATAMTLFQNTVLTALTNLAGVGIPGKMSSFNMTFSTGWSSINSVTATAMTTLQSLIMTALTNLASVGIPGKMSAFNSLFTNGWYSINSATSTAMTTMQSVIMTGFTNLVSVGVPGKMGSLNSIFASGWYAINAGTATAMTQVQSTVLNAISNLQYSVPGIFRSIVNNVIGMTNSMINSAEWAVNSVISGLNNALSFSLTWDVPWWAGGGWYNWSWYPGLSYVNFGNASYLAKGGILDKDTLLGFIGMSPVIGGEAGTEAVLPLDNHTEWMDDVAQRVVARANESGLGFSNGYGTDSYDDEQYNAQEVSLLREQNRLLQQLIEKDYNFEITTGQYEKAQRRSNRRAGKMVIAVGT